MTVVKNKTVKSARHLKRLESYLDWDREKVLGHDAQNLTRTGSARSCMREMESTRKAFGADRPGRAGASCKLLEHTCLAFNPDECDLNGGKMTPQRCMAYAQEYVQTRYPNLEAFWICHRERCGADGTDRYCVHIALNRVDIQSARRLDEGHPRAAARARVKAVRELDARYGLKQLQRGPNSKVHARQPSRGEREWRRRDSTHRTENDRVREHVAVRVQEVAGMRECPNRMRELAHRLESDGIEMTRSKGGDVQFRYRSESLARSGAGKERRANGATLGRVVSRRTGKAVRLDIRSLDRALRVGGRVLGAMERIVDEQYER